MHIIPAIDLRHGKCVRLYQGDFAQQTIYADDPIAMAKSFVAAGAKFIHIVDLDGDKNQQMAQTELIKQIAQQTNLQVQAGGGIRTSAQITELLNAGITKVIIGSLAIINPEQVQNWLQQFGNEKIILAFDVNIVNDVPIPAIAGWQQQSEISLWDILASYQDLKYILCTDIAQDGVLAGPNLVLYQTIIKRYPNLAIQASGGIASLADLDTLKAINMHAAIIGKALYENNLTIEAALQC